MENDVYIKYLKALSLGEDIDHKNAVEIVASWIKKPVDEIEELIKVKKTNNTVSLKQSKIINYKEINKKQMKWFISHLDNLKFDSTDLTKHTLETLSILEKINVDDSTESFLIKGLVIGDIQSGKTNSMIGLTLGAFDLGYEVVVILSGLVDDLRIQTEKRLDKALGVDTDDLATLEAFEQSGVINQTTSGDVNYKMINSYLTRENDKKSYWVIKKNIPKLEAFEKIMGKYKEIADKYTKHIAHQKIYGKVLIIDDESDLASQDGSRIKDESVSKTNMKILNLLKLFQKVSYVAYTATPFANLLTNKDKTHEGLNLFPEDFISIISPGSLYTGFSRYDQINTETNNIHFFEESWIKDELKKNSFFSEPTNIFKEAILIFLVSATLLRYNESLQGNVGGEANKTMLINVDVKTAIHDIVLKSANNTLTEIVGEWNNYSPKSLDDLEQLLKNKYHYLFNKYKLIAKEVFIKEFIEVQRMCQVGVVDKSRNILNENKSTVYEKDDDKKSKENERFLIVIGGHKLSRGLTIPGLLTTFFYRNSSAFDASMQMCRWFGYRDKYIEYTSMYTTENIWNNYYEIFNAYEDLKSDIKNQENEGLTADEFLIKVRAWTKLIPTTKNKMKGAKNIKHIGVKTGRVQIYNYYNEEESLRSNINNVKVLTSKIKFIKKGSQFVSENVKCDDVLNFVKNLKLEKRSHERVLESIGLLTNSEDWDIVIKSNKNENLKSIDLNETISINPGTKRFKWVTNNSDKYAHIKTVLTTDLENYALRADDERWKKRASESFLTESTKPVLFICIYYFKNIADEDEIKAEQSIPVVTLGLYNPAEKKYSKNNGNCYVNMSGQVIDSLDE